MMVQWINVTPLEYQARYSPLMMLFFTVTCSACQKASFVSSTQFSKVMFFVY